MKKKTECEDSSAPGAASRARELALQGGYEQALAAARRGVTAARAPVRIQLTGTEVSVGATNAQPISFPVMIRGIKKLGS